MNSYQVEIKKHKREKDEGKNVDARGEAWETLKHK